MEFASLTPLSKALKGASERRLTIFASSIVGHGRELFEEFFGVPPENESIQKAQFRSEYSLAHQGIKHALTVTGPRLDITSSLEGNMAVPGLALQGLMVQGTQGGPPPEFAVMPNAEGTQRDSFCKSAEEIVTKIPDVKRLAVGEALFWHAVSKESAYEKLSALLPNLKLSPASSSDLYYRINRIKTVAIGGHDIPVNRVSEWTAPGLLMQVQAVDTTTTIAIAAAVKTDINTVPTFDLSVLDESAMPTAVRMLFEFSADISENGDVP